MKKLFLSLAVVFSVALVSCGGNKEAKEEAQDSAVTGEEVVLMDAQIVNDTNPQDTTVAVAVEGETEAAASNPAEATAN